MHEKRGALALTSDKSILDKVTGWLVHDCWSSYFNFKNLKHAICGAHILRELEGLIENGQSKWAKVFKAFLISVYKMPFEERIKRRQHIESRYILICGIGEKSTPPPIKTTTLYTHLFFLSILKPFGNRQLYHKIYQSRP